MVDAQHDFPMVSVLMITYNHELYIAQAIEGVLMQKVDFRIELVIGEDLSKDTTRKICETYAARNPNIIRLLPSERNHGMMPNFLRTIKECHGRYLAMCDGDDYWTDPKKLQKQVDFLESNPDFAICFHKVKILKNNGLKIDRLIPPAEITSIEDLAQGNYIHTNTVVYRNGLLKEFPDWINKSPVGDYVLHMMNSQYGKIKYIDEEMGVYRLHEKSTWSSLERIESLSKWIYMQDILIQNMPSKIGEIIKEVQNNRKVELLELILKNKKFKLEDYPMATNLDAEFLSLHYQNKILKIYSKKEFLIANTFLWPFRAIKNNVKKIFG